MKKVVTFEADKNRNIKFGMNSLIELEKALGRPLQEIGQDSFKLSDLRTILYVGLKWEDKQLTEEQVGDIMDEAIEKNSMQYVSEKIGESLKGAFGDVSVPSNS